MKTIWLVFSHEYKRHVLRWRFLFSLLSFPMFIAIAGLVMVITMRVLGANKPAGLVDRSGLFDPGVCAEMICFEGAGAVQQAEQALSEKEIQGYFLLEADIEERGAAQWVTNTANSPVELNRLNAVLRQRLLAGFPPDIARRLEDGSQVVLRTPGSSRDFKPADWVNLALPVLVLFVFLLAIFSTSGYLMAVVAEEKENRTIEIVLTSTSTLRLMAGKVLASLCVGFTQVAFWMLLLLGVILLGVSIFGFEGEIRFSTPALVVGSISLLLAFTTLSALMAAVGAVVAEAAEGQQITGPFSLPFILPLAFLYTLAAHPHGNQAVALSLVPFTAPLALTMRLVVSTVPAWQVALSLLLQTLTALGSLWLAGRLFEIGMLQFNQTLSLRQILNGLGLRIAWRHRIIRRHSPPPGESGE